MRVINSGPRIDVVLYYGTFSNAIPVINMKNCFMTSYNIHPKPPEIVKVLFVFKLPYKNQLICRHIFK